MKKSFVVIGMGRFGKSVVKELSMLGHDVLAVDSDENNFGEITNYVTGFVVVDCRDEEALKALNLKDIDAAIVSIGADVEASILTTMILKQIGVKYVLAKAQSDLHAKVLIKVGADKVVLPEKDMGARVAQILTAPTFLDYMEFTSGYKIVEIKCPKDWISKRIKDLNIKKKFGMIIVAIKMSHNSIDISPDAEYTFIGTEEILIIGPNDSFNKIY